MRLKDISISRHGEYRLIYPEAISLDGIRNSTLSLTVRVKTILSFQYRTVVIHLL